MRNSARTGLIVAAAFLGWGLVVASLSEAWIRPPDYAALPLPCEFEVRPENRLYVYDHRVTAGVLSLAPGDSLRINGVPVMPTLPKPAVEAERLSDERLTEVYGRVPLFQELVQSGLSVDMATREYFRANQRLWWRAHRAYEDARAEGAGLSEAYHAVLDKIDELDEKDLVSESRMTSSGGGIELRWRGMCGWELLNFEFGRDTLNSPEAMENERRWFAGKLYDEMCVQEGPRWCVITPWGELFITLAKRVEVAREQLRLARETGEITRGPLTERSIRNIIYNEGRELPEADASSAPQPSN